MSEGVCVSRSLTTNPASAIKLLPLGEYTIDHPHTFIHTSTHSTQAHTPTLTQHSPTYTHTHTHRVAHADSLSTSQTNTTILLHTNTHARTHTHIHTYTYTQTQPTHLAALGVNRSKEQVALDADLRPLGNQSHY